MAKKVGTGAKKTVGRARKGDVPRGLVKLVYVQKANGAYAPKLESVPPVAPAAEQAAE
jgi:hypothetical protein